MIWKRIIGKIVRLIGIIIFILTVALCLVWILLARPSISQEMVSVDVISVNAKRLYQHVKVLSLDYLPRNYCHPENLNASAAYIKNQFEEIGLDVTEQKFTVGGIEYKNVISSLGPQTGPKLIIGAHYDVAGPYPGADDNASGVAGLIELARLLKSETLNKNVTLVAYTLEDPPFFATKSMGSYIHAQKEREKDSEIELMISLEMIGYFSEEKDSQTFPLKILSLFYPDRGNFIAVVDQLFSNQARDIKLRMAKHMSLPVYSINAPAIIPGIDFSDHLNYWAYGYDAVMITDTSFYRNFAYHTEQDTFDRLDYKKMAQVVQGIFGYVKEWSEKN